MKLQDQLRSCGFQEVDLEAVMALNRVLGTIWADRWLPEVSRLGEKSEHFNALKAAMASVSETVDAALRSLGIEAKVERRLQVFQQGGKPLRAAVAALIRGERVSEATAFVSAAFGREGLKHGATAAPKLAQVHRVYGANAAMVFEVATSRHGETRLQVEGAGRGAPSGYDWANKVAVQLAEQETLQILAVCIGARVDVEIVGHGTTHDKRLTVRRQEGQSLFFSIRQGKVAYALPLPPASVVGVRAQIYRVLAPKYPHMAPKDLDHLVREI